jgi:hypothetical protein
MKTEGRSESHEDKCCLGNSLIDVLSDNSRKSCAIHFVDFRVRHSFRSPNDNHGGNSQNSARIFVNWRMHRRFHGVLRSSDAIRWQTLRAVGD